MGYEDSVYLAKLAEKAERYEGKHVSHELRHLEIDQVLQRWSRT